MTAQNGFYGGAGSDGVNAMAQTAGWLCRTPDFMLDFGDFSKDWPSLVSEVQWAAWCWKGKISNLCFAIPMAVMGGGDSLQQLTDIAAGKMDAYYTAMGQAFVTNGFPKAMLRPGHEFNGGWYPWSAAGRVSHWIAAFRRIFTVLKAVSPTFQIVWCPSIFEGQIWPDQCYPGDAYVDVVGLDAYNESYDAGVVANNVAVEPKMWASVYGDSWGIGTALGFAKTHGKPFMFPEWGTGTRGDGHGGGDDLTFMQNMVALIADPANNVVAHGYWDYNAADFAAMLSDGSKPLDGAVFLKAFGGAPLQAIFNAYAKPFTPETPPVITVTNCHAEVIQNAPGHWMLVAHAIAAHPSATVAWNIKPSNANLYDPAKGTTPIKALGQAQSATFTLTPNKPLVIALAK